MRALFLALPADDEEVDMLEQEEEEMEEEMDRNIVMVGCCPGQGGALPWRDVVKEQMDRNIAFVGDALLRYQPDWAVCFCSSQVGCSCQVKAAVCNEIAASLKLRPIWLEEEEKRGENATPLGSVSLPA